MSYHPITTRVFVPASRNAVLIELASDCPQHVRWRYDRSLDTERSAPTFRLAEAVGHGIMEHILADGTGYAVAVAAANSADIQVVAAPQSLDGVLSFGGELGPLVLAIGIASTFEGDASVSLTECATGLVSKLDDAALVELRTQHSRWWHRFWAQSSISLDDGGLSRLWHFGLYALGASTRPDTSPPNLQGLWVQDEVSPWHTDFHFNTNVQECQWAACSANHPELQAALVRVLTKDWAEEIRRTGREVYGVDAPALNLATDWKGRAISSWGYLELCVTAWTAQHVWEQYLYTGNIEVLRDGGYAFLCGCAELYLGLLAADEQGQLNIELSHSPEQIWFDQDNTRYFAYGRNPAIDISCIRTLFEAVVAAAALLGTGDDVANACEVALPHLAPLPVHDGVLVEYETAFFHDGDRVGRFPHCHRHPSRLMPVFPGRQIGLHSDPETLDLGRRSFREFRSYGEEGFTGWSYAYQACIAARLGLAEEAETCLRTLCEGFLFKGMLTSHNSTAPGVANQALFRGSPLFQIDALLGAVAAVNEMLVQRTADGVIRVFPAMPEGRNVSFDSLRVPGAVLVSAARSPDGVEQVMIRSEHDGDLALVNPWPGGAETPSQTTLDGNVFRWFGEAGRAYGFAPKRPDSGT